MHKASLDYPETLLMVFVTPKLCFHVNESSLTKCVSGL